ncbi:ABC transporter permease family protein [Paracoccus mutanolyticus]|nr:hypothetical protein [Paracoccus mutanolyticus]
MPPGAGVLSVFFYARLPLVLREFGTYALYRLECALRSSAVLGFIGLPTLGFELDSFELDSFFRQGMYGAVAAVLIRTEAGILLMRRDGTPAYGDQAPPMP